MPLPSAIRQFIPFRSSLRRGWDRVRPLPGLTLQSYGGPTRPSPFGVRHDSDLEVIGRKYKPTKRLHDYLRWYHLHFQDIRHAARAVLEIGIDSGQSLAMWEEYFPNAQIHGIDIRPECKQYAGGRRIAHIGDAGDRTFLDTVQAAAPDGFDIVIDDGSHWMQHQLASFDHLFPRLTSHGIYILEDTGACIGDTGSRVINRLAGLIRHVNYWPPGMPPGWWPPNPKTTPPQNWIEKFPLEGHWADRHIVGISFYRWMVVVQRGLNPDDNPFFAGRTDHL